MLKCACAEVIENAHLKFSLRFMHFKIELFTNIGLDKLAQMFLPHAV